MELVWTLMVVMLVAGGLKLFNRRHRRVAILNDCVDAFRLGDGEEGERLFAELVPLLRGVRDRYEAASQLMGARAFEHALELTQQALELEPSHAKLIRLRALLYGKMVRPEAVDELGRCLESHPRDAEVTLELGALLLRLRRIDELEAVLVPYLVHVPEELRARSLMGRGFFFAGRYEEATAHLEEAMAIRQRRRRRVVPMYDPDHGTGYSFRFAAEGQWEEEQDRLFLDQIRTGVADARVASEVLLVEEEEVALPVTVAEGAP